MRVLIIHHKYLLNVVRVTKVEPDDVNNLAYFDNVVNLIHLLKNSTEDYYNMKKVVGW